MIKLTGTDGHPVWIMKVWIQMVREPLPTEFAGINAHAVIVLSGLHKAVQETPAEIAKLLK